MAQAPLATPADLGDFLGEDITAEDARAVSVLSIASDLVRAYVGWAEDPTEIPSAASNVTVDVAARVWLNPGGLERDGIDDVQRGFGQQAHERFYLTPANKMMLSPLRPKTRTGGLYTVSVHDGRTDTTIYVPTAPEPSGDPFPWYAADDPLVQ